MKATKSDAHYIEYPSKNQGRCRDCNMFRGGLKLFQDGTCTAVQGQIKPDAHCNYFERSTDK